MKRFFSVVLTLCMVITGVLSSPFTARAVDLAPAVTPEHYAGSTIPSDPISGLYQGWESADGSSKGGMNFAPVSAPESSIILPEEKIDSVEARNATVVEILAGKHKYNTPLINSLFDHDEHGFLDTTTVNGQEKVLQFNQARAWSEAGIVLLRGNGTGNDLLNVNTFNGPIARYTYKGVATYCPDDQPEVACDVVFTYSNLRIAIQHGNGQPVGNVPNANKDPDLPPAREITDPEYYRDPLNLKKDTSIKRLTFWLFCGNKIHIGGTGQVTAAAFNNILNLSTGKITSAQAQSESVNDNLQRRYAIEVDIDIRIIRQDTGEYVDDYFYFRAADIDINRTGKNWDAIANWKAAGFRGHGYSESITLNSGFYRTSDGYEVFIPGRSVNASKQYPGDTSKYEYDSNPKLRNGYKCEIRKIGNEYTFFPTTADYIWNDFTGRNDPRGGFYSGFMCVADNQAGLQLTARSAGATHREVETYLFADYTKIRADSGVSNYQLRSSSGEGGTISKKGLINASAGSSVTYTMTPKPGYRMKSVTAKDGSLIYTDPGNYDATNQPAFEVHTDADGNEYYTFTFSDIHMNHAIHVEWEPITKEIEVKKNWQGDTEDDRPNELTFVLLENGKETTPPRTVTLLKSENWAPKKFENLPYTDKDGNFIKYSVREVNVPDGYWSDAANNTKTAPGNDKIGGSEPYTVLFTNGKGAVPVPKYNLKVIKRWEGDTPADRPAGVTFTLTNDKTSDVRTLTLNANQNWEGLFDNLDALDSNRNPITYSLKETVPRGYTSTTQSGSITLVLGGTTSVEFINKKDPAPAPQAVSIEVNKVWLGDQTATRPAGGVTFSLLENDREIKTITVTADSNGIWKGLFNDVTFTNGYTYTVRETIPAGYDCFHDEKNVSSRSVTFENKPQTVSDPNSPSRYHDIKLPVDEEAYTPIELEVELLPDPAAKADPEPDPEPAAPQDTVSDIDDTPYVPTTNYTEPPSDPRPVYLTQGDSLSPPTGDPARIALPLFVMSMSAGGFVYYYRKKKRRPGV